MKADGGWTKGPWHMEPGGDATIYDANDIPVIGGRAFRHRTHPEAFANLRVATASPELYEALATLANKYARRGPFDELLGASEQPAEIIAAIAALAKARGESATGGMEMRARDDLDDQDDADLEDWLGSRA